MEVLWENMQPARLSDWNQHLSPTFPHLTWSTQAYVSSCVSIKNPCQIPCVIYRILAWKNKIGKLSRTTNPCLIKKELVLLPGTDRGDTVLLWNLSHCFPYCTQKTFELRWDVDCPWGFLRSISRNKEQCSAWGQVWSWHPHPSLGSLLHLLQVRHYHMSVWHLLRPVLRSY